MTGTGPASVRVLDAAVEKAYGGRRKIAWMEVYAGEKSNNLLGTWLPQKEAEENYNMPVPWNQEKR